VLVTAATLEPLTISDRHFAAQPRGLRAALRLQHTTICALLDGREERRRAVARRALAHGCIAVSECPEQELGCVSLTGSMSPVSKGPGRNPLTNTSVSPMLTNSNTATTRHNTPRPGAGSLTGPYPIEDLPGCSGVSADLISMWISRLVVRGRPKTPVS
jgi:hypothetical protein